MRWGWGWLRVGFFEAKGTTTGSASRRPIAELGLQLRKFLQNCARFGNVFASEFFQWNINFTLVACQTRKSIQIYGLGSRSNDSKESPRSPKRGDRKHAKGDRRHEAHHEATPFALRRHCANEGFWNVRNVKRMR